MIISDNLKICPMCKKALPFEEFGFRSGTRAGKPRGHCKQCNVDRVREWNHKTGTKRPLEDAKDIGAYLGVYVAERALSKFFDHIERMPYGNPGYDFICGKGYKIDVKSSCLHKGGRRVAFWRFIFNKNTIADYFLCIGFDTRESLNPEHVWLIPGPDANKHLSMSISKFNACKWERYEQPLDKVISCCNQMKAVPA